MNAFRDYIARNGYSFCERDFKDFYNVLERSQKWIYFMTTSIKMS